MIASTPHMLSFFLSCIILLFIFSSFFKLNPKSQATMDEHKHKILITLVFSIVVQHVIIVVVTLQQLAFHQHYNVMMMMVVSNMEANGTTRKRFVWSYEQTSCFKRSNFWAIIQQRYSNNEQG
jgi:hypothetical protein